jgi:hypothetical protein
MSKIPTQIRLRLSIAFKVVLQGIKVRFGRSVVTVMGVGLGIAFLMSILAGQVIKSGVAGEQAVRDEVTRMFNFFVAEAGVPQGLVLGVAEHGVLSDVETRLLQRIEAVGPREIRRGETAGQGATALLVLGATPVSGGQVAGWLDGARHRLVFLTRKTQGQPSGGGVRSVMLEREPGEDELRERQEEADKARFRNIWIVVIALFVTVIGITNSMLMSVTERFREIGTMKCLGAMSAFVRQMFLIESSLVGLVGAVAGAIVGTVFSIVAYSMTYGFGLVLQSLDPLRLLLYMVVCMAVGMVLAVVAALYPARFASKMLPAHALRSEI